MDALAIALNRLNLVEKRYLKKFGENSLDWVFYSDPLDSTINEVNRAVKILKTAIKKNKPLKEGVYGDGVPDYDGEEIPNWKDKLVF